MNNNYTYELLEKKLNTKTGRKQIQKDIKKVIDHFENEVLPKYKGLEESRTLKCYKAAYYDGESYIKEKYPEYADKLNEYLFPENECHAFYDFCEIQYHFFEEWIEEEIGKFDFNYIGHTSSFYIISDEQLEILCGDNYLQNSRYFKAAKAEEIIERLFYYQYNSWDEVSTKALFNDYFINEYDPEEDTITCIDFIDFILNDFEDCFIGEFADALKIKEYLDGFFKHEINNYEYHLDCLVDNYLDEIIEEEKQEEYQNTLDNIADNYINDPVYFVKAYASYIQFEDNEKLESSEVKEITRAILSDIDFLKHDSIINDEEYDHLKSLTE